MPLELAQAGVVEFHRVAAYLLGAEIALKPR